MIINDLSSADALLLFAKDAEDNATATLNENIDYLKKLKNDLLNNHNIQTDDFNYLVNNRIKEIGSSDKSQDNTNIEQEKYILEKLYCATQIRNICSIMNQLKEQILKVDYISESVNLAMEIRNLCSAMKHSTTQKKEEDPSNSFQNEDPYILLIMFFQLGLFYGKLMNNVLMFEDDRYAYKLELGRSILSSEERSKSWEKEKIPYNDALKHAEYLWNNGDKRFHNEMADYLIGIDEFKNLNRNKLMQYLKKDVAYKYNKVRGSSSAQRSIS